MGEFEIIGLLRQKKLIFAHKLTETQMAFVAKNIFIIKAGYNKEFTDSMIDYKQ